MSGVVDSKIILSRILESGSVVIPKFVDFTFVVPRVEEIGVEVPGIAVEVSGIAVEVSGNLMFRIEESDLLSKIAVSQSVVLQVPGFVEFTFVFSRNV